MRTDFDLPPPTITTSEARKRLAVLPLWQLALIRDMRRALGRQTPRRALSKYLLRQLVQHGELARERSEYAQTFFDF